ncbi:hypothetical protein CR513_32909, partial [Mucuna pruriens]
MEVDPTKNYVTSLNKKNNPKTKRNPGSRTSLLKNTLLMKPLKASTKNLLKKQKNTDFYSPVSSFTHPKEHNNPLRQSPINVTLVAADLTGKHLVVAGKFSVPGRRNIDLDQILFLEVKLQAPLPLASIKSYLNQPFSVFFFFFVAPPQPNVLRRVPIPDHRKPTLRFAIRIRFRVKP